MINQGLARDLVLVSAFVTTSTLTCPTAVGNVTLLLNNLVGIISSATNTHLGVAQVTSITSGVCTLTPRRAGNGWNTILEAYIAGGTERFIFNNQTNSAGVLVSVEIVNSSLVVASSGSGAGSQILQVGATYPAPTPTQLLGSVTYIGFNYPINLRPQDVFFKTLNVVTLQPITNVLVSSFTVNWLTPQFVGEGAVTRDELVNHYIIERSIDNFSTVAQTVTTSALSYVFDSMPPATSMSLATLQGLVGSDSVPLDFEKDSVVLS